MQRVVLFASCCLILACLASSAKPEPGLALAYRVASEQEAAQLLQVQDRIFADYLTPLLFGAVFYDTNFSNICQIAQNTFLTLFYFARNGKTSSGFMDSTISFNYINGGMELNDNACFEWSYYNGAIVSNN